MKSLLKRIVGTAAAVSLLSLSLTSCETSDWLDVNDNPYQSGVDDAAIDATILIPSAQVAWGYELYGQLNRFASFYAQHWSDISGQFRTQDRYAITTSTLNTSWSNVYANILLDLRTIQSKAVTAGNPNFQAVAEIMEANVFQTYTDLHGDIPYSQALGGNAETTPAYDAQSSIYPSLLTTLENAVGRFSTSSPTFSGTQDLIYGNAGSSLARIQRWRGFANSLRLRILLRQSDIVPGSSAQIAAILNTPNIVLLDSNSENAQVSFVDVGQQQNPLGVWINQRAGDYGASQTLYDTLRNYQDPRLTRYFVKPPTASAALRTALDPYATSATPPNVVATPNPNGAQPTTALAALAPRLGVNASSTRPDLGRERTQFSNTTSPAIFFTAAETWFIVAEARERGWVAGDAQAAYNQAVTLSLQYVGASAAEISTYLSNPNVAYATGGSQERRLRQIYLQKWIALFAQGVEAWSTLRQTDWPPVLPAFVSSTARSTETIKRLPYVDNERNLNSANVATALAQYNNPLGEVFSRVWWDVRNQRP